KAKSIMGKLFFQNRWAFITVVIACHGDKNLDADLRNNAFMSMWTAPNSANVYFAHEANGFTSETAKKVSHWAPNIFKGFKFGSPAIRSYCKKIKSDGLSMDANNEFYQYFS